MRFQAHSILCLLFTHLPYVGGRAAGNRHGSGYVELNTGLDRPQAEQLAVSDPPTEAPTVSPSSSPSSPPTVTVAVKASEDPEELQQDDPDTAENPIDGDRGLGPGGIIGISIGGGCLILAALACGRSRRDEDNEASVALNRAGVSADPGDSGPV